MWRCPKCETINNADVCAVCGGAKPLIRKPNEEADGMGMATKPAAKDAVVPSVEPPKGPNIFIVALLVTFIIGLTAVILGLLSCQAVKCSNSVQREDEMMEEDEQNDEIATEEAAEETEESKETQPPRPKIKEVTNISATRKKFGGKQKRYGDIITIETSVEQEPVVQYLTEPERIVLDFENFGHVLEGTELGERGNCFSNIRYAAHEDYTRIVIDLAKKVEYTVDVFENYVEVRIVEEIEE